MAAVSARSVTRAAVAGTALALYASSVVAANWILLNVGTGTQAGVHVIPVGFGLWAPSGVLAAGATFSLRDVVQRLAGKRAAWVALAAGALATYVLSPTLAIASGVSFLVSEAADLLVYSRFERQFVRAVLFSNTVGAAVDSGLFLWLAFGPAAVAMLVAPSVLGKLEVSTLTLAAVLGLARLRKVVRGKAGRTPSPLAAD